MPNQSTISCPHCGKSFALTEDYLAQYGGQQLICDQCNGAMMLPSSLAEVDANVPEPPGVWRDGDLLVKVRGPKLPRRCCVCGEAVTSGMHPVTLKYDPHIRIGRVQQLIADAMAETVTVWYGYCREHTPLLLPRAKRWICGALLAVALLIFIGSLIAAARHSWLLVPLLIASGCSVLLALVSAIIWRHPVSLRRIDGQTIWLGGFDERYLAHLPTAEDRLQALQERDNLREVP